MPSSSMPVSFPRPIIEFPKRLGQATDLGPEHVLLLLTRTGIPPPLSISCYPLVSRQSFNVTYLSHLSFKPGPTTNLPIAKSSNAVKISERPPAQRSPHPALQTACRTPTLDLGQRDPRLERTNRRRLSDKHQQKLLGPTSFPLLLYIVQRYIQSLNITIIIRDIVVVVTWTSSAASAAV